MHVTHGRGSVLRWRSAVRYVLPVMWMTLCFCIVSFPVHAHTRQTNGGEVCCLRVGMRRCVIGCVEYDSRQDASNHDAGELHANQHRRAVLTWRPRTCTWWLHTHHRHRPGGCICLLLHACLQPAYQGRIQGGGQQHLWTSLCSASYVSWQRDTAGNCCWAPAVQQSIEAHSSKPAATNSGLPPNRSYFISR